MRPPQASRIATVTRQTPHVTSLSRMMPPRAPSPRAATIICRPMQQKHDAHHSSIPGAHVSQADSVRPGAVQPSLAPSLCCDGTTPPPTNLSASGVEAILLGVGVGGSRGRRESAGRVAGGSSLENLHAMVAGVSHHDAPVAVDGNAATMAGELSVATASAPIVRTWAPSL